MNLKLLKVVAVIQARLGSTRLPGKVLKKICGKTIIEIITERLRSTKQLDDIVLAIPSNKANDLLASEGQRLGLKVFRGSEIDIVSRLRGAAKLTGAAAVIRVTGDCPLVDPDMIDHVTMVFKKNPKRYDYLGNVFQRTYPDGLDTELFTVPLLEKLTLCLKTPPERELLSTYVNANWPTSKIYSFRLKDDLSSIRLTLDYPEDLELLSLIYAKLSKTNPLFKFKDILDFIEKNPNILKIKHDRHQV